MRILLIEFNPFQPEHVPISLGYIAAYAKAHGFDANILNVGRDARISLAWFSRYLIEHRPRLIGFATYQRNIFLVEGWARHCKRLLPDTLIAIGGPQATFLPTHALDVLPSIDLICRAEGEVALVELARTVREGKPHVEVPGWSGRGPDNILWDGPPLVAPEDLDAYPSPYLDGTLETEGLEEAILLASRGCPYGCSFCYTPNAFGRSVRFHSLERVTEEIEWLHRRGVERFWFADPNFTFRSERVESLLDRLLGQGRERSIWLETRADLVHPELLNRMKRAGVHTVAYGLESCVEGVLNRIRKPLVPEQVERAIRLTQQAGLDVELFCQYGLPGETFEDARRTLDFVQRNRVRVRGNTNAQQMQVYFGTQIQREPERFGVKPAGEPRPAYLSIGPRYETEWMTASEIQEVGRLWKAASEDGGKRIVS